MKFLTVQSLHPLLRRRGRLRVFPREKYIEYGGPDGATGGSGGSVWAEAVDAEHADQTFATSKHFFAKNGQPRHGQTAHLAKIGDDLASACP